MFIVDITQYSEGCVLKTKQASHISSLLWYNCISLLCTSLEIRANSSVFCFYEENKVCRHSGLTSCLFLIPCHSDDTLILLFIQLLLMAPCSSSLSFPPARRAARPFSCPSCLIHLALLRMRCIPCKLWLFSLTSRGMGADSLGLVEWRTTYGPFTMSVLETWETGGCHPMTEAVM